MKDFVYIRKPFENHKETLMSLPALFESQDNEIIYKGRNIIKAITLSDGLRVVVKGFKANNFFKAIIYTFFKTNKAKRALLNAIVLERMGINTPKAIGYMVKYKGLLIQSVYLITEPTPLPPIRDRLADLEPFDENMAQDFARFAASLHNKGILHKDLNNTNVLFKEVNGHYEFTLIDINRMKFIESKKLTLKKRFLNLSLFCNDNPMFRIFIKTYIKEIGLTEYDYKYAIKTKQSHDVHYERLKRIKHPSKWIK